MRVAYADPPYLGQGQRHYGYPEWDTLDRHAELVGQLVREFPNGWAMSLSSSSLRQILPLCPTDVRVAAWCKSFCAFKKGVRPAYAWEPIIYRGGRNANHPPPEKGGAQTTPKDFFIHPITMKKGLTGAKPELVCAWILDLLNVDATDTVVDLFPGTGAMGRAVANLAAPLVTVL
jgi:hypothetical protein